MRCGVGHARSSGHLPALARQRTWFCSASVRFRCFGGQPVICQMTLRTPAQINEPQLHRARLLHRVLCVYHGLQCLLLGLSIGPHRAYHHQLTNAAAGCQNQPQSKDCTPAEVCYGQLPDQRSQFVV